VHHDNLTTGLGMAATHTPAPAYALLALLCLGAVPGAAGADTTPASLAAQRTQFLEAQTALRQGRLTRYRQLEAGLRDYPLYPYLHYRVLSGRLARLRVAEVSDFLTAHPDFAPAASLGMRYLEMLARQRRWQPFIMLYRQLDARAGVEIPVALQCMAAQAQLQLGRQPVEQALELFLVGRSQPKQCDAVFAWLYRSPHLSEDLLWQRIRLALQQDQVGLANYLGRRLPGGNQARLQAWIQLQRAPRQATRAPTLADNAPNRMMLAHGLARLAQQHLDLALQRWQQLRRDYRFSPDEAEPLLRQFALVAARKRHPQAPMLLAAVRTVDQEILDWRLRTGLRLQNWTWLAGWAVAPPPAEVSALQWRYWYGRALQQLGRKQEADRVFTELAGERDYYGFLAADRLGSDYTMTHVPVSAATNEFDQVRALPVLRRAYEWYALAELKQARREWRQAQRVLTPRQLELAARLAADWGWHDRSIFALGKAQSFDDLELRFPLLFTDALQRYAAYHRLDTAWLFALVRSESAFMEDVRSPAGALGLMQVMPATGRLVARNLGLRGFHPGQLLRAETNVPIGSAYLQQLYGEFGGDTVLATAAYNAGPGRVRSWLRRSRCSQPDVWIETIPFDETRTYVKRVLFYASIYDWRLARQVTSIAHRMAGDPTYAQAGISRCATMAGITPR